jgi:hypothetical protein
MTEIITVVPKYKIGQHLYHIRHSVIHKAMGGVSVSTFRIDRIMVGTVYRPDTEKGKGWIKQVHMAYYEEEAGIGRMGLYEDQLYESMEDAEKVCRESNEKTIRYFFGTELGYILSEMSGYGGEASEAKKYYRGIIKEYLKEL